MLPLFAHWVHDLDPVIIQFTETLAVRWYGVAYVAGFIIAYLLLRLEWARGRSPYTPAEIESSMLWFILAVIIGGRLGSMLLYDLEAFARNPLIFFQFYHGGMASHGAFLAGALALWWAGRVTGHGFWRTADVMVPVCAPGIFLGRVANFINGELWGKVTDVPWAVIFPASAPEGTPVTMIAARHPSQLYAAFLEGLVLFAFIQWRFWRLTAPGRRERVPAGQIGGEFLIAYGILRVLSELWREPDADLLLGLSRGTFYSLVMIAAGAAVVFYRQRYQRPA